MFTLPESLTELDADKLKPLVDDALAEYKTLSATKDEDLTDEQVERLEYLASAVNTVNSEVAQREQVAAERAERAAAAKSALDSAQEKPDETVVEETSGSAEEIETPQPDEEDVVIPDDASELVEEAEKELVVTASAGVKRPVVNRVAQTAPEVELPEVTRPKASLVASADVPGFASGAVLNDLDDAVKALSAKLKGFPRQSMGARQDRYGVLSIHKGVEADGDKFAQGASAYSDLELIMNASKEARLPGGSLVAAGGWCAPSETIYDLCSLETVDGILSVPEVTINRGGINFTKGPDFADIYASIGFLQTEAQAEAGTEKNIIDVECPEFEEVRLDAIGYGIKAGILTNAAYPELIRRYLEGGLVAHAHKVNASVIGRIVAQLGTALNFTELGGATADTLNAISFAGERLRYRYRLAQNASLEMFAPHWLREVVRADLAHRTGVENMISVTDAQIDGYFRARNINIQWVYDWQDLSPTATAFPATAQLAIYPAGTFVKGTSDIISLDAMYDSTDLKTNTYSAVFFEEGLLVANTCGSGNLIEVALDIHGRTGAANIGALTAP